MNRKAFDCWTRIRARGRWYFISRTCVLGGGLSAVVCGWPFQATDSSWAHLLG